MPAILSKIRIWARNVRDFFLRLLNRLLSCVIRKTKTDPSTNESKTFDDSENAPLIDNEIVDSELEQTVKASDQLKEIAPIGVQLEQASEGYQTQADEVEPKQAGIVEPEKEQITEVAEAEREQQQTEFFSPLSRMSDNDTFHSCEPIESELDFHTVRTGSRSTDKESNDVEDDEDGEEDSSDGTWNAEDGDESSSSSSADSEGSVHMGESESSDEDAAVDKSDDDEYIGDEDDFASKENVIIENKEEHVSSSPIINAQTSSFRD